MNALSAGITPNNAETLLEHAGADAGAPARLARPARVGSVELEVLLVVLRAVVARERQDQRVVVALNLAEPTRDALLVRRA